MKFLDVILLAISALHLVRGGEHECIGQGVQVCLEILGIDVSSEEEECGVIRSSVECLRGIVNECLCDEREKEVNVGLEILETFLETHCQTEDGTNHAISLVRKRSKKCTDEKAKNCLLMLSSNLFTTQGETCKLIRSTINCLKDIGNECFDDYSAHIKDLEKRFWRNCDAEEEYLYNCPELLTAEYGYLYSPGYPENPSNKTDCWTLIQVEQGKIIFLDYTFRDIDYIGRSCSYGYIEALDGDDRNSLVLGRTCTMGSFNSSSNSLLVHYYSGNNTEGGRYTAKYTTVDESLTPFWDVSDDIMKKSTKCVEENADYILGCFYFMTALHQVRTDFGDTLEVLSSFECKMYSNIVGCVVESTKIKCGETEGKWMNETMLDLVKRDANHCIDSEDMKSYMPLYSRTTY